MMEHPTRVLNVRIAARSLYQMGQSDDEVSLIR